MHTHSFLWLKKGSPSHEAVKSVVFDKKLFKDIYKLSQFCHTGILEVYHSLLLKYCPKSYKGMIARTQLAALDHNNNVHRSQATTAQEERRYRVVFPKAKKSWITKPIMEAKSYQYVDGMLAAVVEQRKSNPTTQEKRKAHPPSTSLPPNIAKYPRPSKKTIIENYKSRF